MSNTNILKLEGNALHSALLNSRLKAVIKPELLPRICEAAVHLLDDKIRGCTEESVLGCLYKAASMGFRLEREYGEVFFIPRNLKTKDGNGKDVWISVCTMQIGYKAWKQIALSTGHATHIEDHVVWEGDTLNYEYGTNSFISHKDSDQRDKYRAFYAMARLNDGCKIFSVINMKDAERYRRQSKEQYVNGAFSPTPVGIWAQHYDKMALRKPIKEVCKMLPLTPAVETAMQVDGSSTYLQKDGTITTISPSTVEETAEKVETASLEIPEKHETAYYDTQSYLQSVTEFSDVMKEVTKVKDTELFKTVLPYVELYYIAASKTATTTDELAMFYNAMPVAHQKNTRLTGILSNRKKEIINANISK